MFFVLSKTVAFLLLPSNFFLLLLLIGLTLIATRRWRAGWWCAGVGLSALLLAGFLPLGTVLGNVLENRFPRWQAQGRAPDGVVVLGGAINPLIARSRGSAGLSDAAERITAIAHLARDYPHARIIFTSGDASLLTKDPAEADYLHPALDTLGVPHERVMLERQARNTAENAVFSKQVAQPKAGERWLLVTSAAHMPRAMGCFRAAGFPVEAYPVDWRTTRRPLLRLNATFGEGLARFDQVVREWLGLVAYRLTGRTDALFPSP